MPFNNRYQNQENDAAVKKIGLVIIGSGNIARTHAESILKIEDAKLLGVFSSDFNRAESLAAAFGIKAYEEFSDVLADSEVDAVDIVGKHNTHADFGLAAASAGKHVIVEKPLDASLAKAKKLVAACRKNNVYLATILQQRFHQNIDKLKKIIDDEQLGRIFLASARLASSRNQAYYDAAGGWRGRKQEAGGGVLINQGIHIIDSLIYLLGDVSSVSGEIETFTHDIEVEDVGVGIIRFQNNALAVISATTSAFEFLPNIIEIHGTKGSAMISGDTLTVNSFKQVKWVKLKNKILNYLNSRLPISIEIKRRFKNGYHRENLQAIITAIKADRTPPGGFNEGLKGLEVVEALLNSAREKRPILLRPSVQKVFSGDLHLKYLAEAQAKHPRVLLINPLNVTDSNVKFSHIGQHRQRQPLDLAYVSSFLKKITGVQLVDAAILRWNSQATIDFINEINPETLIISSTPLDRWQNPDLDISGIFKIIDNSSSQYKILIGAHGTVTPEWVFANCRIDFVVRGEPEKTCLELVDRIISGRNDFEGIAGLSYRKENKIIHNPDRDFGTNLDDYPFPDYDSLPMHLYHYTVDELVSPFSLMLTSRGCPGQCVFCLKQMMPAKYRARSAKNIYREIKYLVDNFGIRSIYFQDWEFLIDKDRVKDLCRLLIDSDDCSIIWGCSARATSFDQETVRLMSHAGCILINFGYESGSPEILKSSHKGVTSQIMKQAVDLCRQYQINIRPFCLVNLPGETVKTIKESAQFVIDNDLLIPHINIPIPYPGTALAQTIGCSSWVDALSQTGRIGTSLDPERARIILKKNLWQGRYGRGYLLNPRFWLYIFNIIKNKLAK